MHPLSFLSVWGLLAGRSSGCSAVREAVLYHTICQSLAPHHVPHGPFMALRLLTEALNPASFFRVCSFHLHCLRSRREWIPTPISQLHIISARDF